MGYTSLDVYRSGVSVAPAIFQVMDIRLSDLDFAVAYLDDKLMTSQNVETHYVVELVQANAVVQSSYNWAASVD